MKKLNASGISHLIVPIAVFLLLGVIGGTYLLLKSNAAPANSSTTSSTSTSTNATTDTPLASDSAAWASDTTATSNMGLTVDQAAASSGWHLCMHVAPGLCIATHGPGNRATIETSNLANWTVHSTRYSGYYTLSNGANNCLRAGSGGDVTVSSNSCDQYDNRELWRVSNSQPYSFKNNYYQNFLGTWGPHAGWHVYTRDQPVGGGFFDHWEFRR